MKIPRCDDIVTPNPSKIQKSAASMPSLASSEANRLEPHVTRHFAGSISEGEELTVFTIEVEY